MRAYNWRQTYVHISLAVHIVNALVLIKREEFLQKTTRDVKETPRRIFNCFAFLSTALQLMSKKGQNVFKLKY